jgi:glycosyltransferase involved in cell wall biosynthesis
MLCAAPLLEGSGTRGRILEALAFERTMVTTTIGAEGLNIQDRCGVVRCDDPESFARAINLGTRPTDARREEARRGRQFVLDHYDWPIVAEQLVVHWKKCVSR